MVGADRFTELCCCFDLIVFASLIHWVYVPFLNLDVDDDGEEDEDESEESEDDDSGEEEDEKPTKIQYSVKGRKPLSPEKRMMRELYNFLMK